MWAGQRLCLGCGTRKGIWSTGNTALESTLQLYNNDAGRRVWAKIESCWHPRELLLADLLVLAKARNGDLEDALRMAGNVPTLKQEIMREEQDWKIGAGAVLRRNDTIK